MLVFRRMALHEKGIMSYKR